MGKKLATFCMLLGHQRYPDVLRDLNTLRKLSNAVIFIARTIRRKVFSVAYISFAITFSP